MIPAAWFMVLLHWAEAIDCVEQIKLAQAAAHGANLSARPKDADVKSYSRALRRRAFPKVYDVEAEG